MDLIILLGILIIPALAHFKIKRSYTANLNIDSNKNLTGQEVARAILDANGLNDIYVVEVPGELSDHYDPKRKTVRLSPSIFKGTSVASVSIAAHECGHAIQDKEGYFFLKIRSFIFPVVKIATSISYFILMIGIIAQLLDLIYFGIALTSAGLIFQLVTLPVEFDASKKAKEELKKLSLITDDEEDSVKSMLGAAAMTYVAGVLASALQVLRLVLLFGRRND